MSAWSCSRNATSFVRINPPRWRREGCGLLSRASVASDGVGHIEAYLRLVGDADRPHWNGRGHFFAAAAEAMRRILVENARRKQADKHGGGQRAAQDLDRRSPPPPRPPDDLLALDEALDTAGGTPIRQAAELVKLRYFAGLTIEQAAEALGISPRTADRYWAYARAWLHQEIAGKDAASQNTFARRILRDFRRLAYIALWLVTLQPARKLSHAKQTRNAEESIFLPRPLDKHEPADAAAFLNAACGERCRPAGSRRRPAEIAHGRRQLSATAHRLPRPTRPRLSGRAR